MEKRLRREERLRRTPRGGDRTKAGAAILFGSACIAGGLIALVAPWTGWRPPPDSDVSAPALQFGGALTAALGVWIVLNAVGNLRETARILATFAARPSEPWLADHAWSARGADDNNPAALRETLFAAAFFLTLLPPFHPAALRAHAIGLCAALAAFDLIPLLLLGRALYLYLRLSKFGRSNLVFRRFPFFLGESLEADFRTPARLVGVKRLLFTLRCIEERLEKSEGDDDMTRVCYEIWQEARTVNEPGREVPVFFQLPAKSRFGTALSPPTPRYWELEVTGEAPGVDFGVRFLVPVYLSPEAVDGP